MFGLITVRFLSVVRLITVVYSLLSLPTKEGLILARFPACKVQIQTGTKVVWGSALLKSQWSISHVVGEVSLPKASSAL